MAIFGEDARRDGLDETTVRRIASRFGSGIK